MDLDRALRTTGAVRDFEDRPVPDKVVHRVLDAARFAPSGGNRQGWRVILLKDPESRRRIRDLYLPGWYRYLAMGQAGLVPYAALADRAAEQEAVEQAPTIAERAARGPGGFAERLDQVPVMLVLLANLRRLAAFDRDLPRYTIVGGASVYPFAWSILLAAHAEGLGAVMTTIVVEEETAVRQLLGVPEDHAVAGVLALGYPAGRRPTRLRRAPVDHFTTIDSFDGPPLGG